MGLECLEHTGQDVCGASPLHIVRVGQSGSKSVEMGKNKTRKNVRSNREKRTLVRIGGEKTMDRNNGRGTVSRYTVVNPDGEVLTRMDAFKYKYNGWISEKLEKKKN